MSLETVKIVVEAFTAVVALIALALFRHRSTILQKRADTDETRAATESAAATTDRLNTAVANLGADKSTGPNIEVRIGGIYTLEQVARENLDIHVNTMELITAYVRHNAPVETDQQKEQVRMDCQVAMEVLGRRTPEQIDQENEAGYHLDLRKTALHRVEIIKGNLSKANLQDANLVEANLEGADLQEANLEGAQLQKADLQGADLHRAQLQNNDLSTTQNLTQRQIDAAFGDGSVILPDGLTRPAHWPAKELDDQTYHQKYQEYQKFLKNHP